MAHKLEVLKPRSGTAVVVPPRIVADASLSFSFKLPANFARPAPLSAASVGSNAVLRTLPMSKAPVPAAADDSAAQVPQQPSGAWSDSNSDDDNSWETRDFSAPIESAAATKRVVASNADDVEADADADSINGDTAPTNAQRSLEIGVWEEQDALALPDDFPLLLVNLTRLQREHFPPGHSSATDDDMRHVFDLVKDTLHRHFTQMVEVLFEQKSCFHTTYGSSRIMLESLHTAYPDDVFGLVDYPSEIQGEALSEFLHVLARPSRWRSVEYLKDCLRHCSRDIKWKRDVALELDVLAAREFEIYTAEQDRLGAEIDELTRLRDSFKDKLAKLAARAGASDAAAKTQQQQQYLLLRKLEDIETRLVSLLDTYLAEPELFEHECVGMFGGGANGADDSNGASAGMNVLDMVVAMIFSRLPRDFAQQLSSEEHFEMLLDHHVRIRRLWKKDFGRLPPRTSAATYALSSDDDNDNDSDGRDAGVELAVTDAMAHMALDSEDDDDGDDDDNAFGRHERMEEQSSLSPDSWESVYADDDELLEDKRRRRGSRRGDDVAALDRDDGYGADYDSDESESESEGESGSGAVASADARASVRTESCASPTSKPVRRVRVRRVPSSPVAGAGASGLSAPGAKSEWDGSTLSASATTNAKSTRREAKKVKKEKTSKKKKREKTSKKKAVDDAPFTPFACTSALSFLRIAKENEMF